MLQGIVLLWFVLTAGAVVFVVWDSLTNTPTSWVQRLSWILVTIYTGPVGLFVYLLACRSPGRGLHDVFTRALWKQGVNSEMHCLAGDATGIVIAAAIVPTFGLPNGIDLMIEYVSAFIVGLLVFQALMMVGLKHGCMTLPGRDGPAPYLGHRSSEPASMAGMAPEHMSQEHHMKMRELPAGVATAWMVGTFLLMLGAAWLATFAAPISFSRPMRGM